MLPSVARMRESLCREPVKASLSSLGYKGFYVVAFVKLLMVDARPDPTSLGQFFWQYERGNVRQAPANPGWSFTIKLLAATEASDDSVLN